MTEKGKTVQIAGQKSSFPAKITLQPRCIVISDECWREIAEAEHPGMQVIGPRDAKPGAKTLADVLEEGPQMFEVQCNACREPTADELRVFNECLAEVRRKHGLPMGGP